MDRKTYARERASQCLSEGYDTLLHECAQLSLRQLFHRIDSLENESLSMLLADDDEYRSSTRIIANEIKIILSIMSDTFDDECSRLFVKLNNSGFSRPSRRATCTIMYAEWLSKNGRNVESGAILEDAIRILSEEAGSQLYVKDIRHAALRIGVGIK